MPFGEIVDFAMIPEAIVVGDAYAVKPDALGLFDKLVGFDEAVHRRGIRVRVDVYYQVWRTAFCLLRSIVESVTGACPSQGTLAKDQFSSILMDVTTSPGVRAVAGSLGEMALTTSIPSTTAPKTACAPSR